MGLRSLLAKDWKLDVDTSVPGATDPVWTPVKGLTSFQETTDDNTEEDSDFDDEEGWGSEVVTERKWKIEAEGRRKRTDDAVFTADPGQEAIRRPPGRSVSARTSRSGGTAGTARRTLTRASAPCRSSPRAAARRTWSRSTSPCWARARRWRSPTR